MKISRENFHVYLLVIVLDIYLYHLHCQLTFSDTCLNVLNCGLNSIFVIAFLEIVVLYFLDSFHVGNCLHRRYLNVEPERQMPIIAIKQDNVLLIIWMINYYPPSKIIYFCIGVNIKLHYLSKQKEHLCSHLE